MNYVRSSAAALLLIASACGTNGPGTTDDDLVSSEFRVTSAALRNELQWVDKEHSLKAADGTCAYVPPDLVAVDDYANASASGRFLLRRQAQVALQALLGAANAQPGTRLTVLSAYRDFSTQVATSQRWADECVSAHPGHSEHQLGTTVDLAGMVGDGSFSCNVNVGPHTWILQNAHRFGFTPSYPDCNGAGYRPEPWHIRWVGTDVATAVFRARTSPELTPATRETVSMYDFFSCHAAENVLPFVFNSAPDPAAPTDTRRVEVRAGVPVSVCAANQRYWRPVAECLNYCGTGACGGRDQAAICRVFPKVTVGEPQQPPSPTPTGTGTPAWDCARSRYGAGQLWTCTDDGSHRAKCGADGRITQETCSDGCEAGPTGVDDQCRWNCARSKHGTGQVFTCTEDLTARAKCDAAGRVIREACGTGCTVQAAGTDDTCR